MYVPDHANVHVLCAPVLGLALVGCSGPADTRAPRSPDLVARENQLPGDSSWALQSPSPGPQLQGYGSRMTVRAGQSLDVAVDVEAPRAVRWAVYRVGWYGGAGARRILDGGPVPATHQPACPRD